jgi:hypothetical protein
MRALLRLTLDGFIVLSVALFAILLLHALRRFRPQGSPPPSAARLDSGTAWNRGLRRPAFLPRSL